jgi:hypothetical protein
MLLKQLYAVFFLCVASTFTLQAQEKNIENNPFELSFRTHYGFLAYHHNEMRILQQRHLSAFEIAFTHQPSQDKKWAASFGYPELGIMFIHFDLGSPTYLGQAYCIMPTFNFTLSGRDSRSAFFFRLAPGIGYVTKTFNRVTNYKNIGISTHLNAAINFLGEYRYTISDRLNVKAGISLSHLSNGSFEKPNAGLNMPTMYMGMGYRFQSKHFFHSKLNTDSLSVNKHLFTIVGIGGAKQDNPIGSKRYPVWSISGELTWPSRPFQRFGFGLDYMHDGSNKENLQSNGIPVHSNIEVMRIGANLRYEFQVGRASINLGIGPYLYRLDKTGGPFYERLALRYFFAQNIFGQIALKTHWGNADYVEYGVGIRL